MSAAEPAWTLFRYRNADGTSKDWAYRCLADGRTEVRWGRTGRVTQVRTYGPDRAQEIPQRAAEKQHKGYVPLGAAVLRRGALEPLPAAAPSEPPSPKPSSPPIDLSPVDLSPIDLSGIAAGKDDFWF